MPQTTEVIRRARERLRQQGLRSTPARRLVLEALHRSDGPQSPAELNAALNGQVPVSSLYRTLTVLESVGVLDRHHDLAGLVRFEFAEWLAGHHHHLTCLACGDTSDVDFSPDLEREITRLAAAAGAGASFRVQRHRLDMEGLCARCR